MKISRAERIVALQSVLESYGDEITREQLKALNGRIFPHWFDKECRTENGYSIKAAIAKAEQKGQRQASRKSSEVVAHLQVVGGTQEPTSSKSSEPVKQEQKNVFLAGVNRVEDVEQYSIPAKDPAYIAWGHHNSIKKIISSSMFYVTNVNGHTGNGKTTMIEQVCAQLKRECIRVNFTKYTDEDDLMGGFRLVNGQTQFEYGPVIIAMKRGAILLLDEMDAADPARILCLQAVLEGKPVLLKKINEVVYPQAGFNVMCTSNTKFRGEQDRYIATNAQNDALIDRISVWFNQSYASPVIEKKILDRLCKLIGENPVTQEDIDVLTKWAAASRKAYDEGGDLDEFISTRRLIDIIKGSCIFGLDGAIDLCLGRYDETAKASLSDMLGLLRQPEGDNKGDDNYSEEVEVLQDPD